MTNKKRKDDLEYEKRFERLGEKSKRIWKNYV